MDTTPLIEADGKLPEEDEMVDPDDDDQDEGEDEGYVEEWHDEDLGEGDDDE